jgi:predicted permease
MCIRTALGAMRTRVIRQLLTESVLLATMGGVAGLIVAYLGAQMLLTLAFPGADRSMPIHASPSPVVIGFGFALSLLTGVLFGMAPAWMAAQAQPAEAMRSNARTTAQGSSLLQRVLVVLQASLSLVLLVGAGLFSQSLSKLENTDMRLNATNRYIAHINPQAAGYTQTQLEPLYRTIEQRFHEIPGVVHVGLSTYTPMEDNNWGNGIRVQGQPNVTLGCSWVKGTSEYFDSVGTRVVMGRGFELRDTPASTPVAVVNQTFVKDFFKDGRNPIGAHIGYPESSGSYEIVGVVEDTAYTSVQWKDHRMYFVPLLQRDPADKDPIENDGTLYAGALVIETSHPMNDLESITRKTLASINPNLTVVKYQTFSQQIADCFTDERMIARLTMLFGALALLLATLGLYGVTAYSVVRRTSEIGIRMALGAERSSVVAMVMRGAAIQAAIGLAIGIPISLLCVRFVKTELYEITSVSPGVLAVAVAALALAATLAGLLPARRAASINPMQALRVD